MTGRAILPLVVGCLLTALTFSPQGTAQQATAVFKSGVFDPPRAAPELGLQGSNGSVLELRRYRGKVVAVAFGFTHCIRVCPTTLATLAQVATRLGKAAEQFQVVFVTVDPQRDSPERLRSYLALFDERFVGATGPERDLRAVRRAYGVTINKDAAADETLGYQVHHSSSIFLIDRQGQLRLFVPFGRTAADIADDIKRLLE